MRLTKEREAEIRSKYFCIDEAHKELLAEIDALREALLNSGGYASPVASEVLIADDEMERGGT